VDREEYHDQRDDPERVDGMGELLSLDGGGAEAAELRVCGQGESRVGVRVGGLGEVDVLQAFLGRQERRPARGQHVDAEAEAEDRRAGGRVAPPEEERQPHVDETVQPGPHARLATLVLDRGQDPHDPVGAQEERDEGEEPADHQDWPREEQDAAQDQQHAREIGRPRPGRRPRAEAPDDRGGARGHRHDSEE
jgi:hypothetical protein